MAEPQPGFNVDGIFFPLVTMDDWLSDDWKLARRLTDLGPMELATPDVDELLFQLAAAAVAFARSKPDLTVEKVHKYFSALNPMKEIEAVGFEVDEDEQAPKEEAAVSPPSETLSDRSSSSTEPSTDASPETSAPNASGTTGSDTGSQASHLG